MADQISLQEESWLRTLAGQPYGSPFPVIGCWKLIGQLNLAALETALRETSRRHDALRRWYPTTYSAATSQEVEVPLNVVSARSDAEAGAELVGLLRQRFLRARPPLWRVAVVRLGKDRQLLGLAFDHLIADPTSVNSVLRTIGECYEAACSDAIAATGAVRGTPRSYAEFARTQRELMAGEWGERRRLFWRQTCESCGPYPPSCSLGSTATGAALAVPGEELQVRMPVDTVRPALLAASEQHVTEFSVVASALICSFDDISGGRTAGLTADALGRTLPGVRRTAGLFAHGSPVYRGDPVHGSLVERAGFVQVRLVDTIEHALPLRTASLQWQEPGLVCESSPPTCVLAIEAGPPDQALTLPGIRACWISLYKVTGQKARPNMGTTCFVGWARKSGEVSVTASFNPAVYPLTAMSDVLDRLASLVTGGQLGNRTA